MNILILGGTGEARQLAGRLVALGHAVTTSLAGRTESPLVPQGGLRLGGFGGAEGLAQWLHDNAIDHLIDATHPYAARISANAVAASKAANVPLLRLMRPQWHPLPGQHWHNVPDAAAAAAVLPTGASVLLTTGHTRFETFLARQDCHFVARMIEPPAFAVPQHVRLLLSRPPYALAAELDMLRAHAVTHLVSKNSGGEQAKAKLEAARQLGVEVIMIARPTYEPTREAASVEAALALFAS